MKNDAMKFVMTHPDTLGAGAKKRRTSNLSKKDKVHVVMKEYKRGTLYSGSGEKVKSRKQAIAIAMSEARRGHSPLHTNPMPNGGEPNNPKFLR